MVFGGNHDKYGDDYFADTRMSFGDHIEDLRTHLIRAIIGFCVGLVIGFVVAPWVLGWIDAPIKLKLREFYTRRIDRKVAEMKRDPENKHLFEPRVEEVEIDIGKLKNDLGIAAPAGKKWQEGDFKKVRMRTDPKIRDIEQLRPLFLYREATLITLSIQEALMVYLQIAIVSGLVIGSPWIFAQIWAFISAGLYPHEKRLINVYLPFCVLLFIGGVVFCYFIVIPKAIDAMLMFNDWLDYTPQLRLSEWIPFAIWVPVVFGIAFQTPMVMMALERVGIGTVKAYKAFRKFAWFGMFVVAAVITPTVDPVTFLYLAVPMCLFYELGIILCRFNPKQKWLDFAPEDEDMVEV